MPRAVLESGSRRRVVDNRNKLVAREPFVDGIKTGHTQGAGYVLVGAAAGATARRSSRWCWASPASPRATPTRSSCCAGASRASGPSARSTRARRWRGPAIAHFDERAALVPRRSLSVTVRRGQRVERRVRAPDELEGPLPAGRRVGSVTVVRDGRPCAPWPSSPRGPFRPRARCASSDRTLGTLGPALALGHGCRRAGW